MSSEVTSSQEAGETRVNRRLPSPAEACPGPPGPVGNKTVTAITLKTILITGPSVEGRPGAAHHARHFKCTDPLLPTASSGNVTLILHSIKPRHGASRVVLVVKNGPFHAGDTGLLSRSGRSPGEGHGNPRQCSCLEHPMDRGAWWATVHGVARSRTRLKRLSSRTNGGTEHPGSLPKVSPGINGTRRIQIPATWLLSP